MFVIIKSGSHLDGETELEDQLFQEEKKIYFIFAIC